MRHCAVDAPQCPVCGEVINTREIVHVQFVNAHKLYEERLRTMNDVVSQILSKACYYCYMPLPVTYPLITNEKDCENYLSLSAEELKRQVAQCFLKVEKTSGGHE